MGSRCRANQNRVARAGDTRIGGVRGRDGLIAGGHQGGAKAAGTIGQIAIGRQDGAAIGARKVNHAAIAGGGVVELVLGGDGEAKGHARRGAGGSADRKVRGGRSSNQNVVTGTGDTRIGRVRRGDSLVAGGHQRHAAGERVNSGVGRRERVIRRQADSQAHIGSGKVNGAGIADRRLVVHILGRHGNAEGLPGRGRRG